MNNYYKQQSGNVVYIAIIVVVSVLMVVFGGLAIWAYSNYQSASNDVEGQKSRAVAEAQKKQIEQDEEKFAQREKEPNRDFVGPDDYGRLTFKYPKTWSAYEAKDIARGGNYEAYLNPVVVPPVTQTQQFGLRVLIENKDYDTVVAQYESLIKKGDLRSGATSAHGNTGVRLDGNFTKDIRGSAVIYKLRDKTVTLRTDADNFKPDFEKIIQTISFNQ